MSIVDWSKVSDRANIAVFKDHLADENAVAERLTPFDVVCIMRERTPMPRSLLQRLPNLKLIASTGPRNASIDLAAAAERGISIAHTGYTSAPTIELTWALILASARHISSEAASVRGGGWQHTLGDDFVEQVHQLLEFVVLGAGPFVAQPVENADDAGVGPILRRCAHGTPSRSMRIARKRIVEL